MNSVQAVWGNFVSLIKASVYTSSCCYKQNNFIEKWRLIMSITVVGYSAAGKAFPIGYFEADKSTSDDEMIKMAQKIIRKSAFSSLPVKSLTYQVDKGYVHVLDKINLSFFGKS